MSNIQLKRNLSSTGAVGRSGGSIMKKRGGYDATLNDRSNDDISDYIGGTQNSTHRMGTIAEVQRGNPDMIDEIEQSQSYMMEGSIRDTNRKLVRIDGLTDFLIQENYKKIGIYKTDPEVLFYFWRDYVSVDKRELREMQAASSKSVQPNYEQDAAPLNLPKSKSVLSAKKNYIKDQTNQKYHFKWPVHKKDDPENGIKKGEQKTLDELNLFEKYDYFGVWPEMDVRKTIQDAVDEINMQKLKKENDEQEKMDKQLQDQLRKTKQGKMNEMFDAYYEQIMFRELGQHQKTLKSSPKKAGAKPAKDDEDEEDDYEEDDFEKPVKQSPGEQAIAAVLSKTWDNKIKLIQNDVLDEKTMRHFVKDTLDAIGPTNKFTTENFRNVFRRFDIQVVIDKKKAEEQKKKNKKPAKGETNVYNAIQNKNTLVITQFIMDLMDNAIDISTFQKSQKKYLTEVQVLKGEVQKKDAKFVKQLEKRIEDQKHDIRAIMFAVFFPADAKPGSLTQSSFTKSSIPKDFTNTPKEIMKSFAQAGRQVALKGATSPKSLVDEFFKLDNIIDRIRLLRDKINKSKRKSSNTTEQSYYLNVSPEERLLYMISVESTENYKALYNQKVQACHDQITEMLKKDPHKKIDEKKMLKEAENNTFSDLFKEYSDREKLQKIDFHNTQQAFFQKKEIKKENTIKKAVFGDKWNDEKQELTIKKKTDAEQAVPKDKWKVGRQLKELQRLFPHDRVIQRMVEQEFKTNQTFAYPEEYDVRDQALQKSLKKNFEPDNQQHGISWKVPDFSKEKEIMEAFQGRDRYFEKQYNREFRAMIEEEQKVETYMVESAMDYHTYMSDRSKQGKGEKRETLRQKLAQYYHALIKDEEMGFIAKQRFPHISYGQDPESETFKKSYPASFKRYFFKLVKNIIINKKTGQKKIPTNPPTLKMTVGARNNTKMDPLVMTTMNTELKEFKVGMHITNLKKKGKVPTTWRSRVFRKPDMKKNLKNIFMKQDEVENCIFEPNAYRLVQNKTSHQEKFITDKVPQPGSFFDSLGDNFEKSDPEIFKQGKLKKAKIFLRQGDVDQCIATLVEGFNLIKVYQHNKPEEYRIFQAYSEAMSKLQDSSKKQMKELTTGKEARLKNTEDCGLTWEQEQDVKRTFDENKTLKEDEVKQKDGSTQKVKVEMLDIRKLDKCMRALGFMPRPVEIPELLKQIQKEKDKQKEVNKLNNVIKEVHYSFIDYDRFLQIMVGKLVQDQSLNDLKAAFKILDRDGSGSIDVDEFRDVMRGLSANFSEEEIDKMVNAADVDGDKTISEDEFIMVMRQNKKSKNANTDLVREMQFQVNRFLNQKALEKKFNQLNGYEKRFLAHLQNKQEAERMSKNTDGQAKAKTEDMEKATLKAVYNDLWDIMQWLLNLEKEKDRRQKKQAKQGASLKKTQKDLEAEDQEVMKIYKSIMCPMKFDCPKVKRLRFPYSNLKANRKFGEDCPYAHHPMELQFPQTLDVRMAANKTLGKEKDNQEGSKTKPFVFTGGLFDCRGCGAHCNMCRYKAAAKDMENKFSEHASSKATDKDRVLQIKEKNNHKANQFAQKFGILKKASVLLFYGRANDAFEEVAKAAQIIKDQKAEKDKDKNEDFYQNLIQKYDLSAFESDLEQLKEQYDKLREADINDEFLKKINEKRSHWAGLKLYFRKVCPLIKNQYDRETFLNGLIEDLYFNCEDIILDKQKTKDRIEKLEKQIPEQEDDMDEEELMAQNEDPDNPIKYKKKKKTMCESIQKRKYYKDEGLDMKRTITVKENDVVEKKEVDKYYIDNKYVRQNITAANGRQRCVVCPVGKDCPHAHTAIQLDLTKMQTKKENLQRVVKSLDKKMRKDKALEPWRPSAADFKASDLPDFVAKKKTNDDEDKETEAQKKKEKPPRKGILERENIFRKPYEKGV